MTLLDYVTEQVDKGKKVKVDLINGNLKINSMKLIENCETNRELFEKENIHELFPDEFLLDPNGKVEELYEDYSTSVPNKECAKDSVFGYFEPLNIGELTIQHMLDSNSRTKAKAKLETFVLCCKILEYFNFDNEKHYYWQSKKNKKLIVLKKWVRQ